MNASVIIDELPPAITEVYELHVESALDTIANYKEFIKKSVGNQELINYEFKAAQTLPIFEAALQKLRAWSGDLLQLPDADNLIRAICNFIRDLELIMKIEKELV